MMAGLASSALSVALASLSGEVSVSVDGGPCLDAMVVREAIRAELGDGQSVRLGEGLRVVVVEASGATTIRLFDGDDLVGERAIDTSSVVACAGLTRAVALSVAVTIDGLEISRRSSEIIRAQTADRSTQDGRSERADSQGPRATEPVVVIEKWSGAPRDSATPSADKKTSLHWAMGFEAGGAIGATPEANPTVALTAELAYPLAATALRGEVSGRAGFFGAIPTEEEIGLNGELAAVGIAAGRTDGCLGVAADLIRGRVCGSALIGALAATGAYDEVWVRAGARIDGVAWPVPMLGLTLAFDALANIAPNYVQRTASFGEINELGPASLMFSGGVLVPLQ